MHGRERPRQIPIPRQREDHARHRERHPAQVAEHRDGRADQQQRPRPAAERQRPPRRPAASWPAPSALPRMPCADDLQRDVERGDAEHRQRDGARHGARRVAHLAARHERRTRCRRTRRSAAATCVRRRRPTARPSRCRFSPRTKNSAADGDEQQRQQLGDRGDRVQARAERHAAQVDERPEPEGATQHASSCRGRRAPARAARRWRRTPSRPRPSRTCPSIHSSTPDRNAAYGPNAVPT